MGTYRAFGAIAAALFLATCVALIALWPEGDGPKLPEGPGTKAYDAEVSTVKAVDCSNPGSRTCQRVTFRLNEGPENGREDAFSTVGEASTAAFTTGDRIRVARNEIPPGADAGKIGRYTFTTFERRPPMLILLAIFAVLVLLLGRWRGALSLLGLAVSLAVVLGFIVPAILDGKSPVGVAVTGALAIMFATITLAHGFGPKSLAAALGTAASLCLTIGLALGFSELAHLTGFSSEEANLLVATSPDLSLEGLVIAGVLIGALGVLDDVTVTQASTVLALQRADPSQGIGQLYRGALAVGRDHVAATVNTLVLAYAGSSLTILLLLSVDGPAFADSVNSEAIAEQIVSTLLGSIGLVAAVPITTALAALLATSLPPNALAKVEAAHSH